MKADDRDQRAPLCKADTKEESAINVHHIFGLTSTPCSAALCPSSSSYQSCA